MPTDRRPVFPSDIKAAIARLREQICKLERRVETVERDHGVRREFARPVKENAT